MPDQEYFYDLKDLRFALYEYLPFEKLAAMEAYSDLDRESVDLLLDECAKFNKEVIAPLNRSGDIEGCSFADGKVKTPEGYPAAFKAYFENGWGRVTEGAEYDGMSLPHIVGVAAGEINVGANCAFAVALGLSTGVVEVLTEFGTKEVNDIYIPKLLDGDWQGTMCLTEPQAGSAIGDIKTFAKPNGDTWLISGTKIFISAGDHDMTENHAHLVLARTPNAPAGFKGISLYLVPKFWPNDDGSVGEFNDVTCSGIEHKMGIKSSPTCTLNFGENDACRGILIGQEGQGLFHMFRMMNRARIGVGLQGVAVAAQAYGYAREYAKERVQGTSVYDFKNPDAKRVTIDDHPNVRRMLMWCKAIVEGTRALLMKTAYYGDVAHASKDADEAAKSYGLLEILTPLCKAYASNRGFEATSMAMQVLGGYGYCSEYPIEQMLRDVKIASIYEGTNSIQALDLLGRKLAMKQGQLFRWLCGEMQTLVDHHKEHGHLGKEITSFKKELGRWQGSTMALGMKGMSGDQRYPVLLANPYLQMSGNMVCSWLLLEQAVIAHDKLATLYHDANADDDAAKRKLVEENPDAQFYFNKIETARFFVHQVLVENGGIAKQIESDDRSALNYIV